MAGEELIQKTFMIEGRQVAAITKICAARKLRSDSQVVRELIDAGLDEATKKAGVKK